MRAAVLPQQDGLPAERVREAVDAARRETNVLPWANGRKVASIAIAATGSTETHHNLGHKPSGWFLVDLEGADNRVSRTAWDTKTITLANAGAAEVTVAIWVW